MKNLQNLQKLATDQLVNGLDYDVTKDIKPCEPCMDGKHHRSSFPKSGGRRATKLLEIVHSDVCGTLEAKSLSGAEYFVTFIDDKSRYVWIYILKNKSEVFKKFLVWKSMVEKSSGEKVKTLRSDNGGAYTSKDYLKRNGIRYERTVPKTPEQNGVAERMNRTLVETVRAMLSDSKLPKEFWGEALSTASYVRNRSPTTAVKAMTPYEAWKGYKPNVNHLRIFVCSAYAHIPKDERYKMDPKAKKSIFLGYGIGVKGYRLFDTDTSKVFHSIDVIFNEAASISEQGTEVENQRLVEVECENISSDDDDDENSREATEPQRSPRIRKAPDQYGEWVYIAHRLDDPLTVKEALSSPEKRESMKAMESEINSLNTN